MTENKLKLIMGSLHIVFTSEDDFKFTLAEKIRKEIPNAEVCLEFPVKGNSNKNKTDYIDICIKEKNELTFIELKYKTREYTFDRFNFVESKVTLKNQSAYNYGRLYFVRDIVRCENLKRNPLFENCCKNNFCIFLTNDSAYYKPGQNKTTADGCLRLEDNTTLTAAGIENKIASIKLDDSEFLNNVSDDSESCKISKDYQIKWDSYSVTKQDKSDEFKYLLLKI